MRYRGDEICGEKARKKGRIRNHKGLLWPDGRHFLIYSAGLTKQKLLMSEKEELDTDTQRKPFIKGPAIFRTIQLNGIARLSLGGWEGMLILFFSYMTTAVFNNKTSPVDNHFISQCLALQHPLRRVNVHYIGKCSGMQRLRHEDGMQRKETGLSQQQSEINLYKKRYYGRKCAL